MIFKMCIYVSRERYSKCEIEGKTNEEKAMHILTSTWGGKCEKSSTKDDKNKHIDIYWTTDRGNTVSIDVKSPDSKGGFLWAEAQNVCGGKGAIYGESDYIGYLLTDKLVLVKRERLVEIYENDVSKKEVVDVKPKEFYQPYTRSRFPNKYIPGTYNNDIIFKVPLDDLLKLNGTIISEGQA